ncbi:MAG: hypothetical protein U9R48_01815, partial [Chloroflexota bacterium]|nr:hypothetical protein [Chloroflexota bacterium]
MSRRTIFLSISLILSLILVSGCKEPTPTPFVEAKATATEPQPTDTDMPVPSSTPTMEPTATEEPAVEPTETPAPPAGPALLEPPDGAVGTAVHLVWVWVQDLGSDDWFELQIWPDEPEAEPEAYGWYKETEERFTSADLFPGHYLWRVLVVRGQGDAREVLGLDYVEPLRFTLVRPSLKRGEGGLIPTATNTPTPWPTWPLATATNTPTGPT